MKYEYEVHRLIELPIRDYSELESILVNDEAEGWHLVSTFESMAWYQDELDRQRHGDFLMGIFRREPPSAAGESDDWARFVEATKKIAKWE